MRLHSFIPVFLTVLTCSFASANPQNSELIIRGDRLSGVVLPVLPRATDIKIVGLRAQAWTVDDTKRLLVDHNVSITIGAYTFKTETAIIWINRMPSDAGIVSQIAVYLPTFSKSSNHGGLGAAGENLLIVGSTLGQVTMDVALLKQKKPLTSKLILKAQSRLAGYIQGLESEPTPLSNQPQVISSPQTDSLIDIMMDAPVQANARPWLRPKSGHVSIAADLVELQPGEVENILTLAGNVDLDLRSTSGIDDMQMSAARGIMFLDPGSVRDIASGKVQIDSIHGVYLEGNVVIIANDGNYLLRAPKIYYDFESGKAVMLEAVLRTYTRHGKVPLYIRAKELQQISENQWIGTGVQASTSAFATPDLAIGAARMTITQQEDGTTYVKSENNTMRLGGVPIMYWPHYEGEAGEIPLRKLKFGYKSGFGTSIETKWNLFTLLGMKEPDTISADLLLDGFMERGLGAGLDFDYHFDNHVGDLDMYLLSDSGTQKTISGLETPVGNQTRGYALWTNQTDLSTYWSVQTQLSYISDPTFMSVWRQQQYMNNREFETSIYAKYQKENTAFTALATNDVNQFISTSWLMASRHYKVDKSPEIRFFRYGDSLFGGLVDWSSETRLMRERMVFQSGTPASLGLRPAAFTFPNGAVIGNNTAIAAPLVANRLSQEYQNRLTTRHEFTAPLQFGNVYVAPFASIQGHWGISNDNDLRAPDSTYWVRTAGVRASTQFHRIYNNVDNDLLDLHRLRHIIEPYATIWDGDSNINPMNILQYDASIDNLSTGTAMWFGIRNRLQTWRGGPGRWYQVDWLTFDTAVLFANDGATQRYDNPQFFNWRPEYSSIEDAAIANGKWQFSDGIAFIGNGTWELDGGTFSRGSIGAELDHGKDVRTYIEYREIGNTSDQFLSLGMHYKLSKRYSFDFSPSWNFDIDDLQSLRFVVTRHYPEFDLIGQVTYNEIQNETLYGLRFNLLKF